MGYVEFKIEAALRIEVRIDSTCGELLHRRAIIRVELYQNGDRVHISLPLAELGGLKRREPLLELLNEDWLIVLKFLLFPTETAAETIVRKAT